MSSRCFRVPVGRTFGRTSSPPVGARWGARGTPVIALGLYLLRNPERVSQTLVLNDRALVNFRQTVIGRAGQSAAVSTDLNAAVRVFIDVDVVMDPGTIRRRVVQQIDHPVILDGQRIRHAPR